MTLHDVRLFGTTDSSGDLVVDAERAVFGRLYAIEWVKSGFAAGVDPTLTVRGTPGGQTTLTIWAVTDANTSMMYYPRAQTHDSTGAGLTYDGTRVQADLPLLAGRPRLTVAQGGSVASGGCILYYFAD